MSTEDAEAAAAVCGVASDNHDDGDAIEKAELGVKRLMGSISLFLGGGHGSIIHYLGEVGGRLVNMIWCCDGGGGEGCVGDGEV